MKMVYILFHDGKVARCFSDCKACQDYMKNRVYEYKNFYTIIAESPTFIDYKDEFMQQHRYSWSDYEIA